MSNVIVEELIELTAAEKAVKAVAVKVILNNRYSGDIEKVEEAADEAIKASLKLEELEQVVSELYDVEGEAFIKYIGLNYIELWEDWNELSTLILTGQGEGYTMRAMIEEYEDAYYGYYETEADFARIMTTETANEAEREMLDRLDTAGAIDWQQLWDNTLCHEWSNSGGYYFKD